MGAIRAGGWVLAIGLLACSPGGPAAASEFGIELPAPDLPAPLALPAATAATTLAEPLDGLDLPAAPEVVVDVPATLGGATAAITPPADPPAPAIVQATTDDLLPAAIERRLADPKLPLPPRLLRKDREALGAFYAGQGYRPLWIADGGWNEPARSAAAILAAAEADGLDPAEYPVPRLETGTPVDELAEAELKLAAAAFLYARDARGGRIEPARLSALMTPKLELPTPAEVLARLQTGPNAGDGLASYQPAYPGYQALRAKLAEIRAGRPGGPMVSASRAGGLTKVASAATTDAPRMLPRVPTARLEGDLIANMERWRWLPKDVAPRYLFVNVPEYRLRLIDGGRTVHETRVITGKAATPTPIFTGTLDHAVINPSWFIPPSILQKEILPGLAKDPNYATRRGYSVVRRGKSVTVRQPPGPRNALGNIKFMFPNDHAVYLHDTPNRNLFGSATRAFSHGCVRVEHPFALGAQLLGPDWSEGRLKSLVGYGERMIKVSDRIPVSISYFTVAVDEWGELRSFEDIYGYHRRVRTALGLGA